MISDKKKAVLVGEYSLPLASRHFTQDSTIVLLFNPGFPLVGGRARIHGIWVTRGGPAQGLWCLENRSRRWLRSTLARAKILCIQCCVEFNVQGTLVSNTHVRFARGTYFTENSPNCGVITAPSVEKHRFVLFLWLTDER